MTLEQRVQALEAMVRQLTLDNIELKACCCSNKLHFREAEIYYYPDNPDLFLNDRFPGDACNGAKGILILADSTIFVEFQDWNGGWTLIKASYGGHNICCGCGQT